MMKLFARVRVEVSDELERDKSFLLGLAALVLDLESENDLPSLALRRREGARERVENERGREEARDAPDHADGERHRKVETALRLAVRHARDEERQDGRDEVRRRGEEEPAQRSSSAFERVESSEWNRTHVMIFEKPKVETTLGKNCREGQTESARAYDVKTSRRPEDERVRAGRGGAGRRE